MITIADAAAFLAVEYNLSGMKLQKILYYAQGAALAERGTPLFPEDFQAWRHGPVNREVWEGNLKPDGLPLLPEDVEVLQATWEKYGHLEAYELSALTHADAPWRNTRGNLPDWANSDRVIHKQVIQNFYLRRHLRQRPDGGWEHAPTLEQEWQVAKMQLVLRKRQQERLNGRGQMQFIEQQVIATQRLEGIVVTLNELHGR